MESKMISSVGESGSALWKIQTWNGLHILGESSGQGGFKDPKSRGKQVYRCWEHVGTDKNSDEFGWVLGRGYLEMIRKKELARPAFCNLGQHCEVNREGRTDLPWRAKGTAAQSEEWLASLVTQPEGRTRNAICFFWMCISFFLDAALLMACEPTVPTEQCPDDAAWRRELHWGRLWFSLVLYVLPLPSTEMFASLRDTQEGMRLSRSMSSWRFMHCIQAGADRK